MDSYWEALATPSVLDDLWSLDFELRMDANKREYKFGFHSRFF